jgi:AraC-like DNA-binding protein
MTPTVEQSYQERRPAAPLAELVSSLWVHRIDAGAAPYTHRNVPNGSVELLCRLGEAPKVIGPLTRPTVDVLPPGSTVVGVRFRPGTAAAVLGIPVSELADLSVDAAEVWGSDVKRLADCASDTEAATELQAFVTDRLAGGDGTDPVVREAVRRMMPGRSGDVTAIGADLCVSERQFRRRCQSAIGVAPKVLHRMLRFQGFLAQTQYALARGRDPAGEGLARLAASAGYADQSHLTRECVRLTGFTPLAFLRETSQHCGCGHDHEASYAPMMAVLFKNGRV